MRFWGFDVRLQGSLRTVPAPLYVLGRGNRPRLAGNVGAGWAFARPRDGAQDVDVPMLASDRSRCCLSLDQSRSVGWFWPRDRVCCCLGALSGLARIFREGSGG